MKNADWIIETGNHLAKLLIFMTIFFALSGRSGIRTYNDKIVNQYFN